ncbi:hypothetical protein BZA70DRAFT_308214, partial [Myxozyma melibiosi]
MLSQHQQQHQQPSFTPNLSAAKDQSQQQQNSMFSSQLASGSNTPGNTFSANSSSSNNNNFSSSTNSNNSMNGGGLIDVSSNIAIDLDDDLPLAFVASAVKQQADSFPPGSNGDQQGTGTLKSADELNEGLKKLDELYEELLQLRVATPNLLRALSKSDPGTKPEDIYRAFASNARGISAAIDKFTKDMHDAAPLFDYATKSRVKNPNGIVRGSYDDDFDVESMAETVELPEELVAAAAAAGTSAQNNNNGAVKTNTEESEHKFEPFSSGDVVDLDNDIKMDDLTGTADGMSFGDSMMSMMGDGSSNAVL